MSLLFSNPEIVRNARIQLRPGRMIAAAVICVIVSVTAWASILHTDVTVTLDNLSGAGAVFALILNVQVAVLLIGGGIYCLLSVHREKELNTFDYQRVTRLSSLELAVGKLFGAPIGAYFIVLCLMPVALIAAIKVRMPLMTILEEYIVLVLGSIAYHALALLVSVLLGRGTSVMGIFLFLAFVGMTYSPQVYNRWTIRSLSPFFVGDLLSLYRTKFGSVVNPAQGVYWRDAFFGMIVPHLIVLIVLYVTFIGWFLLAVIRNLKRDPSLYEVYSNVQAFLFALYLSLLMLGFFPWTTIFLQGPLWVGEFVLERKATPPHQVEDTLVQTCVMLFAVLALILLRNRERVRRRVQALGNRAAGWWAALWPAPYLTSGILFVGAAIVGLISRYRNPGSDWDLQLAIYDVVFLAVWLTRDTLFLQWMNVRRAKRPLVSAILYLIVFYGSSGVIFSALNLYDNARSAAPTAILVPSPLFTLSPEFWNQQKPLWVLALALQGVEALVLMWLHRMRLREFLASPSATAPRVERVAEHA